MGIYEGGGKEKWDRRKRGGNTASWERVVESFASNRSRLEFEIYGVSVSRLGHVCRVGVERGTRRHARLFSLPPASDPTPDFQAFNLSSSLFLAQLFL